MEAQVRIAALGDFRPGDDHGRATIAAHDIKRDDGTADHWVFNRLRLSGSGFDRNDLAAIIMAAGIAEVMRALQLATVRALLKCPNRQGMMAAAQVPRSE